jgi:hypothetical protein
VLLKRRLPPPSLMVVQSRELRRAADEHEDKLNRRESLPTHHVADASCW